MLQHHRSGLVLALGLAACTRARSIPQEATDPAVSAAVVARSTETSSPVLVRSIGPLDYVDTAGRAWSVKEQNGQLTLERSAVLDGIVSWAQGSTFRYLLRNGEVFAQGVLESGSRVLVDYTSPRKVEGLAKVDALSVNPGGICALSVGGRLDCFQDTVLQQDDEEYAPRGLARSPLITLASDGVVKVQGFCFLKAGRISCFYLRGSEQTGKVESDPVTTVALDRVEDFCTARSFACARVDGELWCWGEHGPRAEPGEPGAALSRPRRALPGKQIATMQCRDDFVGVRTKEGELWAFAGKSGTEQPHTLTRETHFPKLKEFAAEAGSLCGIDDAGALHCCGRFGPSVIGDTPLPDCHPVLVRALVSSSDRPTP